MTSVSSVKAVGQTTLTEYTVLNILLTLVYLLNVEQTCSIDINQQEKVLYFICVKRHSYGTQSTQKNGLSTQTTPRCFIYCMRNLMFLLMSQMPERAENKLIQLANPRLLLASCCN